MTLKFTVTGKQMAVGEALKSHLEESVKAAVAKYFGSGIEAHAVLTREAHLYCVELSVHIGRGILMQAHEKDTDPHLAADKAVDNIAKRLRRHKRRLRDHHGNGRSHRSEKASYLILAGASDETEASDESHEESHADGAGDQPVVVAELETELPTLTVVEAVMRLDLNAAATLMFRNSAHGEWNVVYRRPDGNIGWIDPGNAAKA